MFGTDTHTHSHIHTESMVTDWPTCKWNILFLSIVNRTQTIAITHERNVEANIHSHRRPLNEQQIVIALIRCIFNGQTEPVQMSTTTCVQLFNFTTFTSRLLLVHSIPQTFICVHHQAAVTQSLSKLLLDVATVFFPCSVRIM